MKNENKISDARKGGVKKGPQGRSQKVKNRRPAKKNRERCVSEIERERVPD